MERIGVIIPVANLDLARHLVASIAKNLVVPDQFVIINNTGGGYTQISSRMQQFESLHDSGWTIYSPHSPLSVNESWQYGFDNLKSMDLISVLNDDLLVESRFFEKIQALASQDAHTGVFCPETVKDPFELFNAGKWASLGPIYKREGWAFTIRRKVLDAIPPIPTELKTFYGDDWLWYFSHFLQRPWKRASGCLVYHYGSVTVGKMPNFLEVYRRERVIFSECLTREIQVCMNKLQENLK
jgi:hypothetical protein